MSRIPWAVVERAAKAINLADTFRPAQMTGEEETQIRRRWRTHYRQLARAALEAAKAKRP